ncbi:hypothetical protein GGH93_006236 [Coemansia aciculifera]|nr:hypothetical protein GGH93_006236 [Coemansia aciculifera]
MDFSGLESISVEDAAELAEHYTRVASIYARIANTPASPKQTSASLAKQSVMPPAASAAKSGASLSAYMLFAADQRDIIRSENPNLSSQEQIEVISHAWKAASNDLRETYIKRIENTSGSSVASAEPSTTGPKKRAKRTLKDGESTASKKESHKAKPTVNGASKSAKTKAKKVASDDEEDNDSE